MLIELELNTNSMQALLRHCTEHQPDSDDFRENARVREALEALASAINDAMSPTRSGETSTVAIEPQLLAAAVAAFGEEALAIQWLSRPLKILGNKRPLDVPVEDALTLAARLAHGMVT
ncbi:antitoxin Xre/MbcA/ParS toxin-binding domain-containing protein [Pseudomonas coleopterorum]|uniref:antitoxin Xre/MbcA/ParS toxin-binding domain-containing protein n=1 Tax=Pseudomonas coleopterorum TaxID=1605838 RepID=UPI002A69B013|nr:antitoxin Xre/MbcA/ParS toxin-binding domain-containing protein [Pseudomonas coleopterorum]MDY1046963.1 antitoxin Xre/MbcA/ParS toxin-binding domain-containing protein [Pseudomonas coleopterorum]